MSNVTRILSQIEAGDPEAAEQLLPLVYDELRKLAAARLAQEQPGQTLQATALVHEAYLRLIKPGAGSRESGVGEGETSDSRRPIPDSLPPGPVFDSRGHFFAAAAEAMRRILVEGARRKARLRHGGEHKRLELPEELAGAWPRPDEILAVHEALDELTRVDESAAQLVKLHYFAGLDIEEAASVLGIAPRTAYRNWSFARAWLFRRLEPSD